MTAGLQYDQGFRVFRALNEPVRVTRASAEMALQVGDGIRPVKIGDYIITLPSGQQFAMAPTSFNGMFEGLSKGD